MVVTDNARPPAHGSKGESSTSQTDLLGQAFENGSLLSASTTPSLPPYMAAIQGKTGEEIRAELNKIPLFMTELEENDETEAFKALAYEGTPAEVALGFKDNGNECFKAGKWKDAKEFYTKGIDVLQAEQRKRKAKSAESTSNHENIKDSEEEVEKQLTILETCLVNRAACQLSLQNYRSCTFDCAATLRLNPNNIKAYYRSSKALLALSKITEADDVCARGLELDPSNAALKGVADTIIAKNAELTAKKAKALAAEQKKQRVALVLRAALKARGIKMRRTAQPPEMEDARVKLVPDEGDPKSSLVFPTVFLYPLHLQSDFVKEFGEVETVAERLGVVMAEPLPWEGGMEYGVGVKGVECYMETIAGGLVKVGKNVTLLKVLSAGNVEVVDEVVRVFVVPKGRAEAWVKDFKAKKAAEKGGG
jgi:tetratricopeptide (TPR) repeat protein